MPMDMRQMLEQAQNLTRALADLEARFKSHEIEAASRDGRIAVRLNAAYEVIGVRVSPELLQAGDKSAAEKALAEVLRSVLASIRKYRDDERASVTGGMHLPEF
jgi:DNA-binding protein YbaB